MVFVRSLLPYLQAFVEGFPFGLFFIDQQVKGSARLSAAFLEFGHHPDADVCVWIERLKTRLWGCPALPKGNAMATQRITRRFAHSLRKTDTGRFRCTDPQCRAQLIATSQGNVQQSSAQLVVFPNLQVQATACRVRQSPQQGIFQARGWAEFVICLIKGLITIIAAANGFQRPGSTRFQRTERTLLKQQLHPYRLVQPRQLKGKQAHDQAVPIVARDASLQGFQRPRYT